MRKVEEKGIEIERKNARSRDIMKEPEQHACMRAPKRNSTREKKYKGWVNNSAFLTYDYIFVIYCKLYG